MHVFCRNKEQNQWLITNWVTQTYSQKNTIKKSFRNFENKTNKQTNTLKKQLNSGVHQRTIRCKAMMIWFPWLTYTWIFNQFAWANKHNWSGLVPKWAVCLPLFWFMWNPSDTQNHKHTHRHHCSLNLSGGMSWHPGETCHAPGPPVTSGLGDQTVRKGLEQDPYRGCPVGHTCCHAAIEWACCFSFPLYYMSHNPVFQTKLQHVFFLRVNYWIWFFLTQMIFRLKLFSYSKWQTGNPQARRLC